MAARTSGGKAKPTPEGRPAEPIDFQSLVEASPDVVVVTDLDGRYRYLSPACHALFGWNPAELKGEREDDIVHPDDISSLHSRYADDAGDRTGRATYRLMCHDGEYRWIEAMSHRIQSAGTTMVVSVLRDITERERQTVALEHRASIDPLTGVANRTVMMDRLSQGLHRLERGTGMVAVLYLDLDRFKVINDSLGHRIGDEVLLKMAERLSQHLRPADTLARLGGDEFVIVAEDVAGAVGAAQLAERIVEAGREPFVVGDESFVCTLSVGIACTADSQASGNDLLHEADLALYRAKDRGRDRAELFDEELKTTAVGRLVTERMLRRALDESDVVVEYQPIVDMRSGLAVSAEALVRIRDAVSRELLLPASFLEVAEETGLLICIDELVLADAATQLAYWRTRMIASDFSGVAVNVTARHLADAGFCQGVMAQLDARRLPPTALHLELTERVLMEASNSAMTGLRVLREAGVQVGLDDFGTGYSSLAYLRDFPLDFLKIDPTFIADLERDKAQRSIVASIINLAHALGLIIVAEGVESDGQRRILQDQGCDRAQGFLFASSGAPATVESLVLAGQAGNTPGVDSALGATEDMGGRAPSR